MERCKTCKYWMDWWRQEIPRCQVGRCLLIQAAEYHLHTGTLAQICSTHPQALFMTHAEFGCVHHEPKEALKEPK